MAGLIVLVVTTTGKVPRGGIEPSPVTVEPVEATHSPPARADSGSLSASSMPSAGSERQPAATDRPVSAETPEPFGIVQPVAPDANPSVALVVQSAQQQTNPERFSPMVMAEPFDRAGYLKDPESYLVDVVPSRVYQVAQPADGVPRLRALTSSGHEAPQGQWVDLIVRGEPGMPVTFNSFDLGEFPNQLTTITVAADTNGVARTRFRGTPGTQATCDILCASPVCSGQLRFKVNVIEPIAVQTGAAVKEQQ